MNITKIIPGDASGYCDVETGECVVTETGTTAGAEADDRRRDPAPDGPPRQAGDSR